MEFSEKFRNFMEWVEHGRTVAEAVIFVASLGVGTLVRALASEFVHLRSIWLTPIMLLSTALFLSGGVLVLQRLSKPRPIEAPKSPSFTLAIIVLIALLAFLGGRFSTDTRPSVSQWIEEENAIKPLTFKTFTNEVVELDGKRIENSTFINTTLAYRGLHPFLVANNRIKGPLVFKAVKGPAGDGASVAGLFYECIQQKNNCDPSNIIVEIVDDTLEPIKH